VFVPESCNYKRCNNYATDLHASFCDLTIGNYTRQEPFKIYTVRTSCTYHFNKVYYSFYIPEYLDTCPEGLLDENMRCKIECDDRFRDNSWIDTKYESSLLMLMLYVFASSVVILFVVAAIRQVGCRPQTMITPNHEKMPFIKVVDTTYEDQTTPPYIATETKEIKDVSLNQPQEEILESDA